MSFGKAIRQRREARGWSRYDLASEAQISRSYVSYLENDTRTPSVGTIETLAKVFGMTMTELVALAKKLEDLE